MAASLRRKRITRERETKTEPIRPQTGQPVPLSIRMNLDPAAASNAGTIGALGGNGDHQARGLRVNTELPIDAQNMDKTRTVANSDLDVAWSREELDAALSDGDIRGDGNARGARTEASTCPHGIDWDQFIEVD